jgi:formamidopyrimidine-DNA glycosylase
MPTMPELPDVEAYARNLEKRVAGQTVTEVLLYRPGKANVTAKQLNNAVASAKPVTLAHDGKEVLIRFDNGKAIRIHLMLEGRFDLSSCVEDIEFKVFAFRFGELYLVVSDPKGWAKLELEPHGALAPDALSADFSPDYFLAKLDERKSKNIKALLTDQDIVRGIGNAYVDEILWEARVSPESKAGKLPKEIAKRLYRAIGTVLRRSVDEILHIAPDIINGEIRDFMRVHNRKRKTSPNGFPIHSKLIASKTTFYTEEQIKY